MTQWVRLAGGLALLLAVAVAAGWRGSLNVGRDQLIAVARAVGQLAVVAAALRGVFTAPATVIAVIAVMYGVAVWTAAGRLRALPGAHAAVATSVAVGAAPVIAVIVGLPALDRSVRTLVAVAGIVIGGTMTATTLAGRHLAEGLHRRREEIEGWLAIGATPRQAVADVARHAAAEALVPGLDQTRTVGLVTLPGAFVGALLGGASPVAAARFQLAVLVGLICAQTLTALCLTRMLGAPTRLPAATGTGRGVAGAEG